MKGSVKMDRYALDSEKSSKLLPLCQEIIDIQDIKKVPFATANGTFYF
jgi:hypothetical protein